jgi:hypothetical protein
MFPIKYIWWLNGDIRLGHGGRGRIGQLERGDVLRKALAPGSYAMFF